jgi:hypothetical protein
MNRVLPKRKFRMTQLSLGKINTECILYIQKHKLRLTVISYLFVQGVHLYGKLS